MWTVTWQSALPPVCSAHPSVFRGFRQGGSRGAVSVSTNASGSYRIVNVGELKVMELPSNSRLTSWDFYMLVLWIRS